MTSIPKTVSFDKLDNIVNKYNNTCHSTNETKPVDVRSNAYISSSKEINNEDPKFKIGDIVRISKCKNIFAKAVFEISLKKCENCAVDIHYYQSK